MAREKRVPSGSGEGNAVEGSGSVGEPVVELDTPLLNPEPRARASPPYQLPYPLPPSLVRETLCVQVLALVEYQSQSAEGYGFEIEKPVSNSSPTSFETFEDDIPFN